MDQTCTFDSLNHRTQEVWRYFDDIHRTTANPLGIINQVYVEIVETGCSGKPTWDIVVQSYDRIFIPVDQYLSVYYLELERIH
jgi:hypothetical protein